MKNKFEIRGNKVAIFLNRKDGTVTETIIDKIDLCIAQSFKGSWYASGSPGGKRYYVMGHIKVGSKKGMVILHRWITDCPDGIQVDHINHNTLDNTRGNLRTVTRAENCQNILMRSDNTSGFRGVNWNEASKSWHARLRVNNKKISLGHFKDLNQAAEVVHQARVKLMPGYIY